MTLALFAVVLATAFVVGVATNRRRQAVRHAWERPGGWWVVGSFTAQRGTVVFDERRQTAIVHVDSLERLRCLTTTRESA